MTTNNGIEPGCESMGDTGYKPELNFGIHKDISPLTPQDMADYHLIVAALGRGILPRKMERQAGERMGIFHENLLVTMGDAMSKEMLPWAGGQTIVIDSSRTDRAEVMSFVTNQEIKAKYIHEDDEGWWDSSAKQAFNGSFLMWLGEPQVRLMYGMRQTLSREQTVTGRHAIVWDIARFIRILMDDIDASSHVGAGQNPGWRDIESRTTAFQDAIESYPETDARVVIATNQLLGAVHNANKTVLEKFSLDRTKRQGFIDVLDASRDSDGAVAERAGSFGKRTYGYLCGKHTTLFGIIP